MDLLKEMDYALVRIRAILGAIQAIEESDDKEIIDTNIEIIIECSNQLDKLPGYKSYDSPKNMIRNGYGDLARIKDKCIKMGLV